jgi:aldose 1-epimerase
MLTAAGTWKVNDMLVLENDAILLEVVPEIGGSISKFYFKHGDTFLPVLRPAIGHESPLEMSLFPLVPYCNRISGNQFVVNGNTINLKPNFGNEPHACHGDGWISAWEVIHKTQTGVQLGLTIAEAGKPYKYESVLEYQLLNNSLVIRLSIKNLADITMPFGAGIHPYFPRENSLVQFDAKNVVLEGPEHLPTETITLPQELSFSSYKKIPSVWRNLCYTDWAGVATVVRDKLKTSLESDSKFVMVFTPPGEDYFCIEPMSHNIGAFNKGELGIEEGVIILRPGEFMRTSYTFDLSII